MKVSIKLADNGYVVNYNRQIAVIEIDDKDDGEAKAFQELCYILKDLFIADSRYSKHRVYIEIKPGDKYVKPKNIQR